MKNKEECGVKTVHKKQNNKQYLNMAMTLFIVLLMKIAFSGLVWHEVLGLGLYVMFFLHHILNLKYTLAIARQFFSGKVKFSVKAGLILDLLLLIVVGGLLFTSLQISNYLFWFKELDYLWPELSAVHAGLAYLTLILIGLHIGLHWSSVMKRLGKLMGSGHLGKAGSFVMRIAALGLVAAGIFSISAQKIPDKFKAAATGMLTIVEKALLDEEEEAYYRDGNPSKLASTVFVLAESDEEDEEDEVDEKDEIDEKDDEEVDGTTSSSPKKPAATVDGTTSSSPTNPNYTVDGITSSSPLNPSYTVDGTTSSSPTGTNYSVDGTTSSTTNGVTATNVPQKYIIYEDEEQYATNLLRFASIMGMFTALSYYGALMASWFERR